MPTVSVVLSSYNHEKFINDSIKSILNQTFDDFELIIIDDCSSDSSWEIIQSYKDSRIRAIRMPKNTGAGYWKDIPDMAKGEFIAIAHSDDYWRMDKLEKQYSYMLEHPTVGACFSEVVVIDDSGTPLCDEKNLYCSVFKQKNRDRFQWLRFFFVNGNCLCHPSVFIRKELYYECGLQTSGLSGLPDFCQWIRVCLYHDIYIYHDTLTFFRVHGGGENTSADTIEKRRRLVVEEYLLYSEFLKISREDEFIQVFPEAEEYKIDGKILIPFAFAKIMLEMPKKHCKLYGLQLLYCLFQNPKCKLRIIENYKYDLNSFDYDKQRFAIFDESEEYVKLNLCLEEQLNVVKQRLEESVVQLSENKKQLEECNRRLQEIQESFFWRSTMPFQKAVRFIKRIFNI